MSRQKFSFFSSNFLAFVVWPALFCCYLCLRRYLCMSVPCVLLSVCKLCSRLLLCSLCDLNCDTFTALLLHLSHLLQCCGCSTLLCFWRILRRLNLILDLCGFLLFDMKFDFNFGLALQILLTTFFCSSVAVFWCCRLFLVPLIPLLQIRIGLGWECGLHSSTCSLLVSQVK